MEEGPIKDRVRGRLVTRRPDGTRIFGYCPDCVDPVELIHTVESNEDGRIVQSLWCVKCDWRRWL